MTYPASARGGVSRTPSRPMTLFPLVAALLVLSGCASQSTTLDIAAGMAPATMAPQPLRVSPPSPDPRVGLSPGLFDAGEAIWNLRKLSSTPPPPEFVGITNSDLAFTSHYAIQGNYSGV